MRETFPMVPAAHVSVFTVPFVLIVVGIVALLVFIMWRAQHTEFVVTEHEIAIKGVIFSRRIPMSAVVADSISVESLTKPSPYALSYRTKGTSVPGYHAGWFRMKNGGKALAYVTAKERVVVVPTTAGYTLLASAADPDGFIAKLREAAKAGG